MTLYKSNPRAKQRWVALGIGLAVTLALSVGAVLAVHGIATEPAVFELDGDALDETPPAGPNPDGTLPDDWDAVLVGAPTSSNFLDVSFIQQASEGPSADTTYYFGGASKDDIDIDTVAGDPGSGGWLRDSSSSTQPKAEILNAYAAAYKVNSDGDAGTPDDTVVYFGMDRYSNDGATFGGFWFLQNSISFGPTANNGVGEIHGIHAVGDVLVITDFTQGGAVANFKVYQWVGSGGDANGVLDELYTGTDCKLAPGTVLACSTVNAEVTPTPWDFTPKPNVGPANQFQPGLFLEGGINISQIIPGNTDPCFTTFVAETRASFSVDSTLSDFASDAFDTCGKIEATKYHDRDANGVHDADGPDNDLETTADNEEVLSGWTIFIDGNANETLDWTDGNGNATWDSGEGERWASTGSDGKVTFADLPTGSYTLCEVLDNASGEAHAGWLNSDPTGATLCETKNVGTGGATTSFDFGNYQNATKSGSKFLDRNADGTWDPNGIDNTLGNADDEIGLEGWTINAYVDTDGDGVLSATEFAAGAGALTDDTDSSGDYTITGLTPGVDYIICEVMEASSWLQSHPTGDAAASECSISTTLGAQGYAETFGSGQNATDNDFGNYQNATVSGTKFKDVNGNDSGWEMNDLTVQGWKIRVYEDVDLNGVLSTGDLFKLEATTDSSGAYSIAGLKPGKYLVCEEAVLNWDQADPDNTVCDQGSLPALDPLRTPSLASGGYAVTLVSGQTYDADFVNTPLSNVHVSFFDLTGSTDASITCVNASSVDVEDSDTYDETGSPERAVQNNGLVPGTYTCTVVITDP